CPSVWFDIGKELQSLFVDLEGCNNLARQAIRAAFHDCFNNGCDGSLILANECSRDEDKGLQDICATLPNIRTEHANQIGMADLIQFAAATAILACPLGPKMPFHTGRHDSSVPAPPGLLPKVNDTGDFLFSLFKARGFTAIDTAALIGAHTTSRQFFVNPSQAGAAQDTTPGVWDVLYYGETLAGSAPFTFQSDINLAEQAEVGKAFRGFVDDQFGWDQAFVAAMVKMSLLGLNGGLDSLVDCSAALPAG
ncbi:class II peroxidase, partial [Lepidopterella palustris CBS 459.81]